MYLPIRAQQELETPPSGMRVGGPTSFVQCTMRFAGDLRSGDELVANVLGVAVGHDDFLAGGLLLLDSDTLLDGHDYTLVMDSGQVLDICVVKATEGANQDIVDFISARIIQDAVESLLEYLGADGARTGSA